MNIGLAIQHLYPNSDGDYEVFTRTDGVQEISRWNEAALGPRPTDQQLQDAYLPALKEQKEAELILAADADFQAIFVAQIEMQYIIIRRMMGQTISAPQQQKARDALALFEVLEGKIRQVRQATTVEEVEAISWP